MFSFIDQKWKEKQEFTDSILSQSHHSLFTFLFTTLVFSCLCKTLLHMNLNGSPSISKYFLMGFSTHFQEFKSFAIHAKPKMRQRS